jgi:hypothetical protein
VAIEQGLETATIRVATAGPRRYDKRREHGEPGNPLSSDRTSQDQKAYANQNQRDW